LTGLGGAVAAGWLRAAYLLALSGSRLTLRPPLRLVVLLTVYDLAFWLSGIGIGLLADVGAGAAALALALLALVNVPFLYADYAIVVDGVGLLEAFTRSVRLVRAALGPSVLVFLAGLIASELAAAAFDNGFSSSTVQPTFLVAYLLVQVVIQYALDVALITIYCHDPAATAIRSPAERI
jgi:hypothetical protein